MIVSLGSINFSAKPQILDAMKLNLLLLGAIAGILAMLFASSLRVMYPEGAGGFLQLYIGALLVVGFLAWLMWRSAGEGGVWPKLGLSILAIGGILSFIAGASYSFVNKTEEFLIYFLLTSFTGLACWVELIRQMVSYQRFIGLISFTTGLIIGLVLALFFAPLVLWIVLISLLLTYGYILVSPKLALIR